MLTITHPTIMMLPSTMSVRTTQQNPAATVYLASQAEDAHRQEHGIHGKTIPKNRVGSADRWLNIKTVETMPITALMAGAFPQGKSGAETIGRPLSHRHAAGTPVPFPRESQHECEHQHRAAPEFHVEAHRTDPS